MHGNWVLLSLFLDTIFSACFANVSKDSFFRVYINIVRSSTLYFYFLDQKVYIIFELSSSVFVFFVNRMHAWVVHFLCW